MPADFGEYEFIRALGTGGLAKVYLVRNTRSGVSTVLKVGNADMDPAAQERFRTECAALQELSHPNIPRLLDFGTLPDGRPYLATEWVAGADLETLLDTPHLALSLGDVLLLTRAVARALGCAHAHGIVHLDVKPANILVQGIAGRWRFEEAKLLDFGVLGKLQSDTHMTRAGMVVGTPLYMSPSQLKGEAVNATADVFSLGVVTYEMLSGHVPFEGKTLEEMFFAVLSKGPKPLPAHIPFPLANLVLRCLDKDPDKRPRSGTELAALIDQLLNALGGTLGMTVRFLPGPVAAGEYTRMFVAPPAQSVPMPPSQPSMPFAPAAKKTVVIAAAPGRSWIAKWAAAAVAVLAVVFLSVAFCVSTFSKSAKPGSKEPWLIAVGVILVLSGVAMGMAVRRLLAWKREQITGEISQLLKGGRTRKALSMTLAIQVDEVIAKCRLMDEKFLGLTMALMVKEYDSARKFDDRQKALMNAIAILDKLGPKLSPWYVRHDKLVATAVSLVGIISGLATAAQSVAKLVKGTT